jgi:flagellin
MTSQINGLNQAVRNANDGISMLQTADGAIVEITNMLQRMRELTVQVASGTAVAADRAAADVEFDALRLEIERIADQTQYNGSLLLNGSIGSSGAVAFQVGANADQTVTHTFSDYQTADATDSTSNPLGALDNTGDGTDDNDGLTNTLHDLTTASNHDETLDGLTSAINNVNARRAAIGSMINRLEFAVDNLSNVSQNASASRSAILDADYASETTELARTQIIQQAATAMLSQANQQAQSVLALLK